MSISGWISFRVIKGIWGRISSYKGDILISEPLGLNLLLINGETNFVFETNHTNLRLFKFPSTSGNLLNFIKHSQLDLGDGFCFGSLVEQLEYVFTLFMSTFVGEASLTEWLEQAVINLEEWMAGRM